MGLFDEKNRGSRDEQIGNLQDLAAKRKAKLLALKKGKQQQAANQHGRPDETAETQADEGSLQTPQADEGSLQTPQVLFRTYKPQNEDLESVVLPRTKPTDIETLVSQQIEDGERAKDVADVEITNLAPKKITFDLRRAVHHNLDKLDRRTDRAISELIRQRLKEGKQQDFLIAVNTGARVHRKDTFDSDED